jgi:putative transposase
MATSLSNLLVHIVFSTKGRVPQIREEIKGQLYGYIGGIVQAEGGILLEIGGMPDHVHLLIKIKADASVAVIVRLIKTNSSRWVNQTLGLPERFEWQTGYGAFSVSESKAASVRRYIQTQEEHHARVPFVQEYTALLAKHRVAYDERYLLG